ncbi:synaptobrevin-1-like [Maniola hyperantus]|uniref:synaptobrevin-1-like n=1 Tax=Aphantopus hyperantus TaxID=2795564 RepID=UPI001568967E|nr:synaptobrevin-1-like [Maniola hyperantus]
MENPSGTQGPRVSDKRLAQTQAKVDEVVGIMRVNVEKVLERDQKLSELDNRADALQHGAAQFEQQAGKLKRKYWWQNLKMMLIIGAVGAVLLIIIIVWATSGSSSSAPAPAPAPTQAPPVTDTPAGR